MKVVWYYVCELDIFLIVGDDVGERGVMRVGERRY